MVPYTSNGSFGEPDCAKETASSAKERGITTNNSETKTHSRQVKREAPIFNHALHMAISQQSYL